MNIFRDCFFPSLSHLAFKSFIKCSFFECPMSHNALCSKSNGRCDIKAEKREELESKSSHKSEIWPPAASKIEVRYIENVFFRL